MQIRRTLRLFEEKSSLQLQAAGSTDEALLYLDGLSMLHTACWQARGKPGSFANRRWVAFHRALVSKRFQNGEIQLLRVGNADGAVGYLYNLVWRKRVYVLQTGFRTYSDKRLMPGYAVHVLAIVYNRQRGMEVYDLMHGDSLYKRLLCNRNELLRWVVIRRKRWIAELEARVLEFARSARKKVKLVTGE
jgi:CelD/BcsL family acetyltransferase involved in cellulose biosynthesis